MPGRSRYWGSWNFIFIFFGCHICRHGFEGILCNIVNCHTFERNSVSAPLSRFLSVSGRHLYKMVDSCRQLTVSQSIDDDTAGMVTLLTGHLVDQLCERSAAMKVGRPPTNKNPQLFFFFLQSHSTYKKWTPAPPHKKSLLSFKNSF